VASLDVDPWSLAVTPGHFEEHLDVLRRRWTVLPLADLVAHVTRGRIPRRAVVVTFDDGYVDNLLVAKPALERSGVPATVFITTSPLTAGREFWWDELEAVFLTPGSLPPRLEIEIGGDPHSWALGTASEYSEEASRQQRDWRAYQPPPTPRHAVFVEVWRLLSRLRDPVRRAALDHLARWSGGHRPARPSYRTLSTDGVRELARGTLIDIGAHTVTHSRLSALSSSEQRQELVSSRQYLEGILGRTVNAMSYPFGGREDYTPMTVSLARDAGFSCACTSASGSVRAGADLLQLPRCFVRDLDGGQFATMMSVWLGS
jgi:peptidoglycan/xylan/chitin deacetylase (PgdA/CDA1 family)